MTRSPLSPHLGRAKNRENSMRVSFKVDHNTSLYPEYQHSIRTKSVFSKPCVITILWLSNETKFIWRDDSITQNITQPLFDQHLPFAQTPEWPIKRSTRQVYARPEWQPPRNERLFISNRISVLKATQPWSFPVPQRDVLRIRTA